MIFTGALVDFVLCVMLRATDYIWQVYLWSSLSKEQNKNQLFGTTTRRYMQSRIVAIIGHATRWTDLFRTTRQQKVQRLKPQGRRNKLTVSERPCLFASRLSIYSSNIFPRMCYLDENFREYFQSNIPFHRLRNQIT